MAKVRRFFGSVFAAFALILSSALVSWSGESGPAPTKEFTATVGNHLAIQVYGASASVYDGALH